MVSAIHESEEQKMKKIKFIFRGRKEGALLTKGRGLINYS